MISVIIPTIWREEVINAVNSVPKRDDVEIIVVGDYTFNQDKRDELIKRLEDMGVYVFVINDTPPGLKRNYGIKKSNGELIAFLDDDDVWLEGKLDKQLSLYNGEKDFVSYGGIEFYNVMKQKKIMDRVEVFSNPKRMIYYANFLPTNTLMFHRDILKKSGMYDERFITLEDWDFNLRLVINTEHLKPVPKVIARYNIHNGQFPVKKYYEFYNMFIKKYGDVINNDRCLKNFHLLRMCMMGGSCGLVELLKYGINNILCPTNLSMILKRELKLYLINRKR